MQSIERAAVLLRDASSFDGAAAILREVGFTQAPLPLDPIARAALGLPPSVDAAWVMQGQDSLRGLALQLNDAAAMRDSVTATANALSRRTPQLLWMLVAFNRPLFYFWLPGSRSGLADHSGFVLRRQGGDD